MSLHEDIRNKRAFVFHFNYYEYMYSEPQVCTLVVFHPHNEYFVGLSRQRVDDKVRDSYNRKLGNRIAYGRATNEDAVAYYNLREALLQSLIPFDRASFNTHYGYRNEELRLHWEEFKQPFIEYIEGIVGRRVQ